MKTRIKKIAGIIAAAALGSSVLCSQVSAYADTCKVQQSESTGFTVTEYFEDVELLLDESLFSADSDYEIAPCSTSTIPSQYYGAYNSSNGLYYLQINSSTDIDFRGKISSGTVFCSSIVQSVYFNPTLSNSDNFTVTYSNYYKYDESSGSYTYINSSITIGGRYNPDSRSFTINKITYTYQ